MQETKVDPDKFPDLAFAEAGYHAVHHSAGRWAGVAIAAPTATEFDDVSAGLDGEPDADEARWLEATAGALRVITTYVPNGRAVDTPFYEGKLRFLDAAAERCARCRAASWSSRATSTSAPPTSTSTTRRRSPARPTSPRRARALRRRCSMPARSTPSATCIPTSRASPGGTTARATSTRRWACGSTPILLSPPVAERLQECGIDRNFRKGPKPSDHAPLLAELRV